MAAWLGAGIPGNLVIAGDGPERQRLTEIANGDPRITFTGHVDRPEVTRLMADARTLLVPSLWEEPAAPPLVVVEAIATGLPVVASGAGGLGEWVRRTQVGWTAPPGDVTAWAEILREVGADEAGVRIRGRAAREEFLRSHSASACIQALVDTYDKVCARGQVAVAAQG
jgi:glycosyltransferase involved in cell wall biosynthesis